MSNITKRINILKKIEKKAQLENIDNNVNGKEIADKIFDQLWNEIDPDKYLKEIIDEEE